MSSRLSDGAVRGEQSSLWLSRVATEFDEVKVAHGEISRPCSRWQYYARTAQSHRFLISIYQILVIFEPDSNLDAKIRKIDFVPSYHRTIVPSRKSILHLNILLLIYIYYYIYYNIYNNIYKYNKPNFPYQQSKMKIPNGTMVRWYVQPFSGQDRQDSGQSRWKRLNRHRYSGDSLA